MQSSSGFDFPQNSPAVWEVLRTRRSIRRYRDTPVPVELVNGLLSVAAYAPSAHNRQPWRWVVVANPANRRALADAMAVDFARDLERDGLPPDAVQTAVERSRLRIGGAPMLVLPCLTMAEMDSYPDPARQQHEWHMAAQSVALAAYSLMLAAHAVGLGSCWLCAPLFCAPTVRAALDLPADWEPQALITLGYAAAPGRERPRRPVSEVALYR